jgi:hypothetical protein
VALAAPAYAQTGNGAPAGRHYNLNLIGVEKDKTVDLTGSGRHTIFVRLGEPPSPGNNGVETDIWLTRGEFEVCDGNGFDQAFKCDGTALGTRQGAVFQLPCNTNIGLPGEEIIPCTAGETAAYEVWVRALGSPKGEPEVTIRTCAIDTSVSPEVLVCSSENVLLIRNKGQEKFENRTNELTSLLANVDADAALERVALFAGGFEDWFWKYINKGVRLVQMRFYLLSDINN